LKEPAFRRTFAEPRACREGLTGRSYSSDLRPLGGAVNRSTVLSQENWVLVPSKIDGRSRFQLRDESKFDSCWVYVEDWRSDEELVKGEYSLGIACD
jgi:hypothetical protein